VSLVGASSRTRGPPPESNCNYLLSYDRSSGKAKRSKDYDWPYLASGLWVEEKDRLLMEVVKGLVKVLSKRKLSSIWAKGIRTW
jgi:hypothetical protein